MPLRGAAILDHLAPAAMRREVLPFAQAREDYQVDLAGPWSWDTVQDEVTRFVAHVAKRQYLSQSPDPWPMGLARITAGHLLQDIYGPAPRRAIMSLVEQQGIRPLLDLLTRKLQEDRLQTYLETNVRDQLAELTAEERYKLAEEYLAALRAQLGGGLAHGVHFLGPTGDTLGWWRTALNEHARLFLGMESG